VIGGYTYGTKTFDALIFGYYDEKDRSDLRDANIQILVVSCGPSYAPYGEPPMARPERVPHQAFLYKAESSYLEHVVTFLALGLRDGERALVFTSTAHWDDIGLRLNVLGLQWDRAIQRRALIFIDAEHVIAESVVDHIFQRTRFDALVRRVVPDGSFQRFYGDPAGLLAARGNLPAALAMEEAGQHVASTGVSVSCGYDTRPLGAEAEWPVRSVVNAHEHTAVQPGVWMGQVSATGHVCMGTQAALILLWDDHPDSCAMYAEALTLGGYRVMTAAAAREAVVLAKAYRPDLLVIDVRLPTKVGVQAMHELRGHGFHRPILALTAHALDAERREIVREGFNAVLSKPCLPTTLVAAVTKALDASVSSE
jgi:CheY-like chemotaxis protein